MNFYAKQGKRYRAKIRLGLFEQIASNEDIAQRFRAAGLVQVTVQGSGRDRWAFGVWPGKDVAVQLPEQIQGIDEV